MKSRVEFVKFCNKKYEDDKEICYNQYKKFDEYIKEILNAIFEDENDRKCLSEYFFESFPCKITFTFKIDNTINDNKQVIGLDIFFDKALRIIHQYRFIDINHTSLLIFNKDSRENVIKFFNIAYDKFFEYFYLEDIIKDNESSSRYTSDILNYICNQINTAIYNLIVSNSNLDFSFEDFTLSDFAFRPYLDLEIVEKIKEIQQKYYLEFRKKIKINFHVGGK